jgi:hypothetical protein
VALLAVLWPRVSQIWLTRGHGIRRRSNRGFGGRVATTVAGAVEFARLRSAHLVSTGEARIAERERGELERLLLAPTPAAAVGLGPDAAPDDIKRKALEGVARWRDRAADPLADPAVVEVFETAARSCESIYATTA